MKSFAFPGNIEPEILGIASEQVPYMRTRWFSELILECEGIMLDILGCPGGRVIPYTASGTAAMDACVASFVSTCKRPLIINGGDFGARWGKLCHYYDLPYDEFDVPFARHPDMALLREQITSGKFDVLLMQHHETSSGYLYDLESVSQLCRANGIRLVVDAISSFLTDSLSMGRWGIDIIIVSSQKGLNLPPGLSFVVISPGILEQGGFAKKAFYFDWDEQLANLKRGQTPFSPATHLFMQLHERLRRIRNRGATNILNDVSIRARAFRQACLAQEWSIPAERMSNCLTAVNLPFPARDLVDYLNARQIYVMPSRLSTMIRVTHSGTLDCDEQIKLVEEIELWLKRKQQ
jgi:aspartate aminotransferase-like enzyme